MKSKACGSTNLRHVNDLICDACFDSRPYLLGDTYVCLEWGAFRQQRNILDKIAEKDLEIKNVENEIKKLMTL